MPLHVAVISEQTGQEPALCSHNCRHILRCLIRRPVHESDNPVDESQSDPSEGNSALQFDVPERHMNRSTSLGTPDTDYLEPAGQKQCRRPC